MVGGASSGRPMRKCPGVSTKLSGSVESSGTIGREFMMASISINTDVSSSTLKMCGRMIFLMRIFICLIAASQAPPM